MSTVYFPAFHGEADCNRCELVDWSEGRSYGKSDCTSYGASQRNRRDFSFASRRCPKIPDLRGFVHESQRENQRKAYPIVYAESNGEDVFLNIGLPDKKKPLRVYETRSGDFYFKTKNEDGEPIKRLILIGTNQTRKGIMDFMQWRDCEYCIFDCTITDMIV